MPKIICTIEKMLNDYAATRLNNEGVLQSYRSYFMESGYTKISKHFNKMAEDELAIRSKILQFIIDHDGCLDLQAIPSAKKIESKSADVVEMAKQLFAKHYNMVVAAGKTINEICVDVLAQEDAATSAFITGLATDQMQAEADAKELMQEVGFAHTKLELWLIDQHITY